MNIKLYDDDVKQIISKYFNVEEELVDVFEDNGINWFEIEINDVEKVTIKQK